jgi:uncharacterized membrane protein (DUF2068 family)
MRVSEWRILPGGASKTRRYGAPRGGRYSSAEEGRVFTAIVSGAGVRGLFVETKKAKRDKWLLLIAILKIVKAVMLLAVAVGAIGLIHHDIANDLYQWIRRLNLDTQTPLLKTLPSKLESMTPGKLTLVSMGMFVYSGLFFTEGIGLFLQKRWAEYFTVVITASFIPFEIYEMVKKFGVFKLVLLLVNVAILIYLVWRLRHEGKKH